MNTTLLTTLLKFTVGAFSPVADFAILWLF